MAKESDKNRACSDHLLKVCPRAKIFKHCDKFTAGIPDSSLTWRGFTTWLEFKFLEPNATIHDELDPIQLVELVRLEGQGLAWVVAFRKGNAKKLVLPRTHIYRPSALLHGAIPYAHELGKYHSVLKDLCRYGVVDFEGFDYAAIAHLIHQSHVITR
jgi:hypothetical protein